MAVLSGVVEGQVALSSLFFRIYRQVLWVHVFHFCLWLQTCLKHHGTQPRVLLLAVSLTAGPRGHVVGASVLPGTDLAVDLWVQALEAHVGHSDLVVASADRVDVGEEDPSGLVYDVVTAAVGRDRVDLVVLVHQGGILFWAVGEACREAAGEASAREVLPCCEVAAGLSIEREDLRVAAETSQACQEEVHVSQESALVV